MSGVSIHIRDAIPSDAQGIAEVHVQGWRESYASILSAEALAGLSVEERTRMWRGILEKPESHARLLVAELAGRIVGFCCGGSTRPGAGLGTEAEIQAIYLVESIKRQGIGRRLFMGVLAHLTAQGFTSAGLWVLCDNQSARRFYEALGGVPGLEQGLEIRGETLVEIAYRFELVPIRTP